ncbi:MAG: phage protease [bacterium]
MGEEKEKGHHRDTETQRDETVITITMEASPSAPSEFLIFPLGQVTGIGMEPFTVDEASIESVRAAHRAKGVDTVIDYEHQTLTGGIAPAAGWIKEFFFDGTGLACRVDWTEPAREMIKNRQYRYYSPVVGLDKTRRLVAIQSMALTNLPRGNNLVPLVMKALDSQTNVKEEIMLKQVLVLLGLPEDTSEEKALLAMKARLNQPVIGQEIMSALNLPPEATSMDVLGAIQGLKTSGLRFPVACTEIMTELGLAAAATKSEAIATIRALKQPQTAGISVEEFQAMKEKLARQEADGLVTEAMKAGKVTAAQKDWATAYAKGDPAGFKMFVEKAPVVVMMKDVGAGDPPAGETRAEITETDRVVMKQMGMSEEDFKKYYRPVG